MSLTRATSQVDPGTIHSIWGFIRQNTHKSIPMVLISVIYLFLLSIDNWIFKPHGNVGISISEDKRFACNIPMSDDFRGVKNVKGNNVIISNCYHQMMRRVCFIWKILCASSNLWQVGDIANRWEIGIQASNIGFYGINQDGFPVIRGVRKLPYISFYCYTRHSHRLHLDVKRVLFGQLLKIKIYFAPESPNTFDIEFHKCDKLFFEYRGIKCGSKLSLSLNFLKGDIRNEGFRIIKFEVKEWGKKSAGQID